jgi:hypothetical protein
MHFYGLILMAAVVLSACGKDDDTAADTFAFAPQKIYDGSTHNAFTDLIRYNNAWYVSFREAASHTSTATTVGKVRVLKSTDLKAWTSVVNLTITRKDLRDPKLSITPDGKLMLFMDVEEFNAAGTAVINRKPYVSFADAAGNTFSAPELCVLSADILNTHNWLWRVTWHKGVGYAVDYLGKGFNVVKTTDGKNFEKVATIAVDGQPNEATIRFDAQDRMVVLIRRETEGAEGVLATATAPYTSFTQVKLPFRVGGPNFVFLDDQTICISSRWYAPNGEGSGTVLWVTDMAGNIKRKLRVPSAGDSSYAGMVIEGDTLYFSYYTSHHGPTHVYWASIPLSELKKTK